MDDWNNFESLLLVSFIQHTSAPNWPRISDQMRNHPLVSPMRPPHLFLPDRCAKQFEHLQTKLVSEKDYMRLPIQDVALILIDVLRRARIVELKTIISAHEVSIRQCRTNIHSIRRGDFDQQLIAASAAPVVPNSAPPAVAFPYAAHASASGATNPPSTPIDLGSSFNGSHPSTPLSSSGQHFGSVPSTRSLLEQMIQPLPLPTTDNTARMKRYIRAVMAHKQADIFKSPVTPEIAPDYANTIRKPIDLTTIKTNIDNGVIVTKQQLLRDLMHLFANALLYNPVNTEVYNLALAMRDLALKEFDRTFGGKVGVATRSRKR